MAKFLCACGGLIRTSGGIPNPQQWNLISDEGFEVFWESEVDASRVYSEFIHAYRCDDCGRLWIFWQGYDASPTEYVPVESAGGER